MVYSQAVQLTCNIITTKIDDLNTYLFTGFTTFSLQNEHELRVVSGHHAQLKIHTASLQWHVVVYYGKSSGT